ncbi:hypothetical protein CRYUN_Cryun30bG0094300 [Craigia yunnanensis]
MTKALEEMWNKLTLTKEERDDIIVEQEWVDDVKEVNQNCALGKILMVKPMNIEAMRSVFIKIWRVSDGLTIREVGDRLYFFHFDDPLEKIRVL